MKCFSCNNELPEKAKFCLECGKEQPKPVPIQTVPELLPEVLTVGEAANLFRISRWKLYDLIRKGAVPYFQIGSHKRFLRSALLEWAAANTLRHKADVYKFPGKL